MKRYIDTVIPSVAFKIRIYNGLDVDIIKQIQIVRTIRINKTTWKQFLFVFSIFFLF